MYRGLALIVDPVELTESVVRDPDDDKLLACALGGEADYIVSGDFDLLELRAYQNISIVTVAACLDFID